MTLDILNNENPGRSPCLTCERRDMDKKQCGSMLCLRLAAYNSGEPWKGKPLPYIKEGNKMEEQKGRKENRENRIEVEINLTPIEKGVAGIAQQSKTTKTKAPKLARRQSSGVKETPVKKKLKATNKEMIQAIAANLAKLALAEAVAEKVIEGAGLIIDLDKFQKIKSAVYDTAEKYFVTPEHVVVGLLGEALAAREPGNE